MNQVLAFWLFAYLSAITGLSSGRLKRYSLWFSALALFALMRELRELPALGDSGFYLGQAADVIEKGAPTYPLANFRSAALAGLVMNFIITYAPALSVYFSSLFITPGLLLIGMGRLFSQNLLVLTTTASVYFLKPNYMDFYPVAVVVGSTAIYVHLRSCANQSIEKLIIAAFTAGLAIASHLLLIIISLAYLCHLLLLRTTLKEKIQTSIIYCIITALVFNTTLYVLSLMNWPMYPGNSSGGGDNRFLAQDLLTFDQVKHAGSITIMAIVAPLMLLFLSSSFKTLKKYFVFVATLCAVYVIFLLFYGFDLGLISDIDLQLFPATVILATACLIFFLENIKVQIKHAVLMAPFVIYAANSISNLPR